MQAVPNVKDLWPESGTSSRQESNGQGHHLDPYLDSSRSSDMIVTALPDIGGGQSNDGSSATTTTSSDYGRTGTGRGAAPSTRQLFSSPLPPRRTSPSFLSPGRTVHTENSSHSSGGSPNDSNYLASAPGGFIGSDHSPTSLASYRKTLGESLAASNSSEEFFFQRDPLFVPRRNHTIGSSSTSARRRLNSHFHFPSQGPTSPSQNSLSAITGGKDVDDDEWETMIKSRDHLVPEDDDAEDVSGRIGLQSREEEVARSPWHSNSSASHRRLASQPSSAQARSPFESAVPLPEGVSGRSGLGHQRSESAHVRSLEHGPFASASTISALPSDSRNVDLHLGMIRRHQSLNHATGRAAASRLQAGGSGRRAQYDVPSSNDRVSPSPLRDSVRAGHSTGSLFYSQDDEGDRSAAEATSFEQTPGFSPSLMDAHARLARMTLQPGIVPQSIREDVAHMEAAEKDRETEQKMKLPALITNRDLLEKSAVFNSQGSKANLGGPVSASAYVPPIGHSHQRNTSSSLSGGLAGHMSKGEVSQQHQSGHSISLLQGPFSAMPASTSWLPNSSPQIARSQQLAASAEDDLHRESSNSSRNAWASIPNTETSHDHVNAQIAMLQQRILQQQQQQQHGPSLSPNVSGSILYPNLGNGGLYNMQTGLSPSALSLSAQAAPFRAYPQQSSGNTIPQPTPMPNSLAHNAPLHPALSAMMAAKGYNPPLSQFDVNPPKARFFVIKSFTEDDVQRSLKHEIWASTEKGNQRLDKAFRECQAESGGPFYLFFSVNASGHFCGLAQMLTPVDYNSTSNVWVQEGKWKGTFKVRWIYVKDVPNGKLRHIKLTNTAECKPVTQSRDTQELPMEGGKEMLHIMAEYQSKTTLLQDWLFYEQQALHQQRNEPVPYAPHIYPNSANFSGYGGVQGAT